MIHFIGDSNGIVLYSFFLPQILLANQLIALTVHIYYEIGKSLEKLKINWITYLATAALEFTIILSWVIIYSIDGDFNLKYYILVGVVIFLKIPINVLFACHMISYYEKSQEQGELIRLDARNGYEGLTLIVMK